MNKEKINAAARAYVNGSPSIRNENGFRAGISYCAANPSVIGCVKLEEMEHVFKWWMNDCSDWGFNHKTGKCFHFDTFEEKSFTELLQIYQQQKQQG
jgi:hypothetical protein